MNVRKRLAPLTTLLGHKSVVVALCAAIALFLGALSAGTLLFFHRKVPGLGAFQSQSAPSMPAQPNPTSKTSTATSQGVVAGIETSVIGQPVPTATAPAIRQQLPAAPTIPSLPPATLPILPVPPKPHEALPLFPQSAPDTSGPITGLGLIAPQPDPLLSLHLQITL